MSPASFLKRPLGWLKAMSEFRATVSGGPNFAYSLCVSKTTPEQRSELDLRYWRLAFCGAEPIRPETLRRFAEAFGPSGFREDAFYPCYGLAEATLLVAGTDGPQRPLVKSVDRIALSEHRVQPADPSSDLNVQELVGCGTTWLGQEVAIVDTETRQRVGESQVGEIWVRGPSVAKGYWNRPEDTRLDFHATIEGEGGETYLRTGDLGFVSDGELFVTGREKEMIIVRGRNLYPHDIELSVGRSHPALAAGAGAAFAVEADAEERSGGRSRGGPSVSKRRPRRSHPLCQAGDRRRPRLGSLRRSADPDRKSAAHDQRQGATESLPPAIPRRQLDRGCPVEPSRSVRRTTARPLAIRRSRRVWCRHPSARSRGGYGCFPQDAAEAASLHEAGSNVDGQRDRPPGGTN